MRRQIPNIITLCNLVSGVVATWLASQGHTLGAAAFILAGIFFDFFDGMAARLLGVSSPLGKELDSLADLVTSGVAPAFILFALLNASPLPQLRYVAFLTPAFAAYRLAKFNLDERQHSSFIGLPAPAAALVWVGIAIAYGNGTHYQWLTTTAGAISLATLSLVVAILMVSELPMFSLKFNFKQMDWHHNSTRYCFLIGCAVLLAALRTLALPCIILWYVMLSCFTSAQKRS
ncbi:MAG: CDP-diacylglycerol--serine O-phosphatidyltransferase [Bacteroidales bacterium]|nr:CDP-diacylglycerol--serine O-phosphatidyltransferase [Bacteroidales bacterium]